MKIKKIFAMFASFLIFFVMGTTVLVFAQSSELPTGSDGTSVSPPTGGGNPTTGSGGNPTMGVKVTLQNPFRGPDSLFVLLKTIINDVLLPIGGVLAVLAFIYSGFLYVTAQGDETQLKTAHKALLSSAIGTAVLLGSWVIANVICTTIGQLGGPVCPS